MKPDNSQWSKAELKTYILLLCAKADSLETKEEIDLIKSKTDSEIFDRLYEEFCKDDEDTSIEKIQAAIERHHYSSRELSELKKEIQQIFSSDKRILPGEQNLGLLLDNILY